MKMKTVKLRLDRDQRLIAERIARDAAVSVGIVVRVLLALGMLKHQLAQLKPTALDRRCPECKAPAGKPCKFTDHRHGRRVHWGRTNMGSRS